MMNSVFFMCLYYSRASVSLVENKKTTNSPRAVVRNKPPNLREDALKSSQRYIQIAGINFVHGVGSKKYECIQHLSSQGLSGLTKDIPLVSSRAVVRWSQICLPCVYALVCPCNKFSKLQKIW